MRSSEGDRAGGREKLREGQRRGSKEFTGGLGSSEELSPEAQYLL